MSDNKKLASQKLHNLKCEIEEAKIEIERLKASCEKLKAKLKIMNHKKYQLEKIIKGSNIERIIKGLNK